MKKKFMALGTAALLALSLAACSSGDTETESSDAPAAEQTSEAPAETQAAAESYTPDQIEAALTAVQPSLEGTVTLLSEEQIAQSLGVAQEGAGQVTTEPAECAGTELLQSGLAETDAADMRILAENQGLMTLAGISGDRVAAIKDQVSANQSMIANCATYTVEVAGQSGTGTMQELDVSIPADEAIAVQTSTDFGGMATTILSINVIRGDTQISATSNGMGTADTPMSVEELEALIEQTFTELEQQ